MDVVTLIVGAAASIAAYVQQGVGEGELFGTDSENQTESVERREELILPDMRPTVPRELYIEETPDGRVLRFSSTFINVGEGPLELRGESDVDEGVTHATQSIFMRDGDSIVREVGEFVLHPTHEHWHVEDYIDFQLWSEDAGEMLASTGKMSFCIWDEEMYDMTLEHAPETLEYEGCDGDVQGLSVGWSDTYGAEVDGQELDISEIPNGVYIVRTVINPDGKILERNYSNNAVDLPIGLEASEIRVLEN